MRELFEEITRKARRMAEAKQPGRRFLIGLQLIGAVGWMVVLPAVGGALLGRSLDERLGTGVQLTLGMLMLGLGIGIYTVWRFFLRDLT